MERRYGTCSSNFGKRLIEIVMYYVVLVFFMGKIFVAGDNQRDKRNHSHCQGRPGLNRIFRHIYY